MQPNMRRLEREYGPYVRKQSYKYARNAHERDDLYQIGLIALWRCAVRYKPGPATFLSYAAHRIKGDMLREAQKYAKWDTPVPPDALLLEKEAYND